MLGGGLEFNVGLNEELLMTTASLDGLCISYEETLNEPCSNMQGRLFRSNRFKDLMDKWGTEKHGIGILTHAKKK